MVDPFADKRFSLTPTTFAARQAIALAVALGVGAGCGTPPKGRTHAMSKPNPQTMTLGLAWTANSVNAVVFRADPITTHGDQQYTAYYDVDGHVVIARRTIGDVHWTLTTIALSGNVRDAHNCISMIADGAGYLHLAWNHHGQPLNYVRGTAPGATTFSDPMPMVGTLESNVTYPQFFSLPTGDLIFLYRDGASGNGNLVIDRYDVATQRWTRLHDNLIGGEGQRNAYWQADVDRRGTIHVSWVWRESPDVASNHDLCYARSIDGGRTWERSTGERYALPITQATAEIAAQIPERSELINQTSMCADSHGRPMIATYFRPADGNAPQYMLVYHNGTRWRRSQISARTTPFTLSGTGSKRIPISRPQVLARDVDGTTHVWVVFRDAAERNGRVSMAACADLAAPRWTVRDLTDACVGQWEPSFDRIRWARDGVIDLFVQSVGQGDGETLETLPLQAAKVLEWRPDATHS